MEDRTTLKEDRTHRHLGVRAYSENTSNYVFSIRRELWPALFPGLAQRSILSLCSVRRTDTRRGQCATVARLKRVCRISRGIHCATGEWINNGAHRYGDALLAGRVSARASTQRDLQRCFGPPVSTASFRLKLSRAPRRKNKKKSGRKRERKDSFVLSTSILIPAVILHPLRPRAIRRNGGHG